MEAGPVDDVTAPVVAGFDAGGDWHDGANGRYAPRGWSSAKALAVRALRGAFARDTAKAAKTYRTDGGPSHSPVWLEAADDYLTRVGVKKGQAVRVRYLDDTYGEIDAAQPDGSTRPVKVKWERFADHLPSRGGFRERTIEADLDKGLPWHELAQAEAWIKSAFEHDLGDVKTRANVSSGGFQGSVATVMVEVWSKPEGAPSKEIGSLWYELRPNGSGGVYAYIQTAKITTQRKGIGTRVTKAIEDGLAAEGVAEVRLGAQTDYQVSTGRRTQNGAYTWARAGFDWDNVTQPAVKEIGERMLALDPENDIGRRLTGKIGNDFPTPGDVALDPIGKQVLLGEDGGATVWHGVKRLDARRPPAAERVATPAVTRNRTKADRGLGQGAAARIKAAGGTGQAIVTDGYLARHGHPKGATVTVTYVDDTYADVAPAEPGGKTIRSKWSHFADDPPEVDDVPDPVDAAALDEAKQAWREYNSADLTGQAARIVGLTRESGWTPDPDQHGLGAMAQTLIDGINAAPVSPVTLYSGHGHGGREFTVGDAVTIPLMATSTDQGMAEQFRFDATENWEGNDGITYHLVGAPAIDVGTSSGILGTERLVSGRFEVTAVRPGDEGGTAVELRYLGPAHPPGDPPVTGPFDRSRGADGVILDALGKPDLVLPMDEATNLHTAKLSWLAEEGQRRGMTVDEARRAVLAIDTALDQSTDTIVWSRSPLDEAVAAVDAGHIDSDLARGVVLQRAFTDAVWQARYGDAATIPATRFEVRDDPSRQVVPQDLDGATSWVVRENEDQVAAWFARRDLRPDVVRWDIPRERALLLPWGEGRMRSDYVRIHGEVLVAGAPPKATPPRDLLLDPAADPAVIADAIYGSMPGVSTRNPMVRESTTGPPHAPVTHRTITIRGERPAATPGDLPDMFMHSFTVAPGVDGKPHVTVFDSGSDIGALDVLRQAADAVDADAVTAYSPTNYDTRVADARAFVAAGFAFHPSTDPYLIRNAGLDIRLDHPGSTVAAAWENWDGGNVADLPQPQVLLEATSGDIEVDALRSISYLGVIDRTGRRRVPELPREGGHIDWGDVANLPDGTVVSWDGPRGPVETRVTGHQFTPPGVDDFSADYGGRYPQQAKVVRYPAAPLPAVPPLPDPRPGVKVRGTVEPARPLVYPGKVVTSTDIRMERVPRGVQVRRINDRDTPFYGDGGWDEVVEGGGQLRPVHDSRPSASQRPFQEGVRYMVTVVPDTPGDPIPDDLDTRVRNALLDATRTTRVKVADVAPLAVGAVDPPDWVANGRQGSGGYPEVKAATRVLLDGLDEWSAATFPGDSNTGPTSLHGTEAVGPLWRLPGPSQTRHAVYSTTPVPGVEPEVLAAGNIEGAARDGDGWFLWGTRFTPVPWRDPQPSPLDDDRVTALTATFADPTQPSAPIDAARESFRVRDGVRPTAADITEWLHGEADTGWPKLAVRADIPGRTSVTGPARTVRVRRADADARMPERMLVEWFPYPIGSPEMDALGWDPASELVLPVDDPRLPAVLDAAWWRHQVDTGAVDRAVSARANGGTRPPGGDAVAKVWNVIDAESRRLREEHLADGMLPISRVDGRWVIDPDGTPVPAAEVLFLRRDGDRVAVAVTTAAARQAGGPEPDYRGVYDTEASWEEKAAALAQQRDRVLGLMPGDGLDAMFGPVPETIERRVLTDDGALTAGDRDQLARVEAVAEYGAAVHHLAFLRRAVIQSNSARDGDYQGSGPRPLLPEPESKALAKALDGLGLVDAAAAYDEHTGGSGAAAAVEQVLAAVAARDARVDVRVDTRVPGSPFLATRVALSTDRTAPNTLAATRTGAAIRLWFGPGGHLLRVETSPVGEMYGAAWNDETGDPKAGKKAMRAAERLGLVSAADPRPTLAELAFIETLEALGVDMSTDPDVRVGKGNPRNLSAPTGTAAVGRGTSPEVYAARVGLNIYPRSWTSTLLGRPQGIKLSNREFERDGGGSNSGGRLITIADPRRYPQHRDTVVHEFGHTMEATVPGLLNAQQWYLAHRLRKHGDPAGRPTQHGVVNGNEVWTWEDSFARSYSGRLYNRERIAGNSNFEAFTTAMDGIVNLGTGRRGADDDDLVSWAMGVTALVTPPPGKEDS